MKETGKVESCKTCKHRAGTKCHKNKEYVTLEDWCSAFKKKKGEDMTKKEYIQQKPEEYNPEEHEHLFTEEETRNLSLSLRSE